MSQATPLSDALAKLLDERSVVERLYEYCAAADVETPDAFVDCFTPDGLFTYRVAPGDELSINCRGHEQLRRWFCDRLPVVPPGTMNHTTVHPSVTIDGDRGQSTSRFISIRAGDGGLFVASTGSYEDRLVRCDDGRWRFVERHTIGDMPR